jgi:hypothetical protein
VVLSQRFSRFANLALPGQEYEHIARALPCELVDGIEHRVFHVLLFFVLVGGLERVVTNRYRIRTA